MNLYHISRKDHYDYDEFSDAVVCCEDEATARNMHPGKGTPMKRGDWGTEYASWTRHPDNVVVKYLGVADKSVKPGVISNSFHAG